MGRAKCFLTYSCLALAMRGVFVNSVALQTRNAVAKRCVFADLYTCFIYDTLYFRLKLAGSSHIPTKFMDAQRRTALIFVTQGVGCSSCMCDCSIKSTRPGFQIMSSPCVTIRSHHTNSFAHIIIKFKNKKISLFLKSVALCSSSCGDYYGYIILIPI